MRIRKPRNCCFFELLYTSNFTDEILFNSVDSSSIRSLKKRIITLITPFYYIEQSKNWLHATGAESRGWMKFWDAALDNGPNGTISSLSILKLLCQLSSMTECVPWNYVTSSSLRTVPSVITLLLNTLTWSHLSIVPLKNSSQLASSYVTCVITSPAVYNLMCLCKLPLVCVPLCMHPGMHGFGITLALQTGFKAV